MMKKILVSGGAGFIGSHLCTKLIEMGHEVICLDNLSTGTKHNIDHLLNLDNFTFVEHDIITPFFVEVDEIYHLACPASPIHYQYDAIKTIKTAVVGTFNLIELADKTQAKILLASTSEIYGDPIVHPQPENYWGNVNPIGKRSCYDEGKRCAETIFMDYHRQRNVRVKIVRIFNTYGPKMLPDDGRVISNFIGQALRNEAITIYGNGRQSRSFQYIDDLIDGLLLMMDSDETFTGPVNIGNPEEYTVLDLAKKIIALSASSSELVFQPLPEDDPQQRKPDIALAKLKLNWAPQVPLEQGLKQMIAYFTNNYNEINKTIKYS